MLSNWRALALVVLSVTTCQGLKMSPGHWLLRSPLEKRQLTTTSTSPQTTTITANFQFPSGPADTCSCTLASPYTSYVTITSFYTATASGDGTTTTTLAQPSGSRPGTVQIISPLSFITTTTYYEVTGTDTTGTVTATVAQPTGTAPGTVIVEIPAQYTTITSYQGSLSSTTTTTAQTYTGGSKFGTIIVYAPASYTTITSYNQPSGASPSTTTIATYTGGTSPGTVEVDSPGIYDTSTTYWGQNSTVTSTSITYTGPAGTTTNRGLVIVQVPATNAAVATSPTASIISRYTAPASTESPVLPSSQSTSPVSSTVPAPTGCNNQGLEWAQYPNVNGYWSPPGPNNDPKGYANFSEAPYKMMQPQNQGLTENIAGFNYTPTSQGSITIYNSTTIPSDFWTLNHQGYIYAPQTGVYNITSYIADDIVLVWLGPLAYTGWTRSNAALEQVYNDPPQGFTGFPGEPPVSFTTTLQEGQYYPIRILYANAEQQAEFHLYVIAPDGTEFLGPDSQGSPYIVRYSCDRVTAPEHPAFGNQS